MDALRREFDGRRLGRDPRSDGDRSARDGDVPSRDRDSSRGDGDWSHDHDGDWSHDGDGDWSRRDGDWRRDRSLRDVVFGQKSRGDQPATVGGRGYNYIDLGGRRVSAHHFDDHFDRHFGHHSGSRHSGWSRFGLGFGLGLVTSNWNDYWYDHYLPHHHRHWYRGAWNWYPRGVRYVPWLYSYSNWGYNILPYRTGYVQYYNPYWDYDYPVTTTTVVYDYREPIIVEQQVEVSDATEQQAVELLDQAMVAFKATDYDLALDHVDASLRLNAHDPIAHELRALILFATGRYTDAAATLNALLAVAPGWDWATMRGLYPSGAVYTDQLRALEAYRNSNPQSADARFVLAYHYLVAGHTGAAERELARVVELEPRDDVAAQILSALRAEPVEDDPAVAQGAPADTGAEELLPPADPVPADLEQDAETPVTPLPGRWSAEAEGGLQIELVMDADSSFTWTAREGDRTHVIEGEYSVNGPLLILEDAQGEAMLARLVPESENRFRFVLVGGPEDDPGLVFNRR